MKWTKKCPKCDSDNLVRIPGQVGAHGVGNNINTGMTIFGAVKVTRYVCVKCGFTEEWIDDKVDVDKLKKKYESY